MKPLHHGREEPLPANYRRATDVRPFPGVGGKSRVSAPRLAAVCALVAGLLLTASARAQMPHWMARWSIPQREAGRPLNIGPLPPVARIIVPEKDGTSYGSGTLVAIREQNGLIVTNWHVVRDASGPISVLFPDTFQSPAQVLKVDQDWDLAALAIFKPNAAPMPLSAMAPQPGEDLLIAGYGSGQWRAAAGKCTQYVAPSQKHPAEMVEVSASARQGDSGGPIVNARGELAGVLFGTAKGVTSGSYSGRVREFLVSIVPELATETPAANPQPFATASVTPPTWPTKPPTQLPAQTQPPAASPAPSTPPKADAYASAEVAAATVPPNQIPAVTKPPVIAPPTGPGDEGRLASASLAPRAEFSPSTKPERKLEPVVAMDAVEPREFVHTPLPPRLGHSESSTEPIPPDKLLGVLWTRFAGTSYFDQGKTIFAMLGVFVLVIKFMGWGRSSHRDDEGEE